MKSRERKANSGNLVLERLVHVARLKDIDLDPSHSKTSLRRSIARRTTRVNTPLSSLTRRRSSRKELAAGSTMVQHRDTAVGILAYRCQDWRGTLLV